jgi:hypothetical protein
MHSGTLAATLVQGDSVLVPSSCLRIPSLPSGLCLQETAHIWFAGLLLLLMSPAKVSTPSRAADLRCSLTAGQESVAVPAWLAGRCTACCWRWTTSLTRWRMGATWWTWVSEWLGWMGSWLARSVGMVGMDVGRRPGQPCHAMPALAGASGVPVSAASAWSLGWLLPLLCLRLKDLWLCVRSCITAPAPSSWSAGPIGSHLFGSTAASPSVLGCSSHPVGHPSTPRVFFTCSARYPCTAFHKLSCAQ